MTPQEFIHKWKRANLSERSAYQQHFLDLCELLNQPKPAAEDPDDAFYTFERVHKTDGSHGWADVWFRGHFGWEYKKKHKDLDAAYNQLNLYREDLENPPLLIVCDLDRFEIHTNFTNTAKQVHRFDLLNLGDPGSLDLLKKAFTNPEALRPTQTTDEITKELADEFAALADSMQERLGIKQASGLFEEQQAHRIARFLMKLMFCMFAEDIELLQDKLFGRILASSRRETAQLSRRLKNLFQAMADGGEFGADMIRHFNGGLFADTDVIELTWDEIELLIKVNEKNWTNVEPSIFGTLFERLLDPAKRSQIGAHYTSREDILTLLEPVLMAPLRREWEAVKAAALEQWPNVQAAARKSQDRDRLKAITARPAKPGAAKKRLSEGDKFEKIIADFLYRLADVKVLDPACGSGNFLYVAIKLLLDLEKEVIAFAHNYGYSWLPHVRPTQLLGIEINPFAQELAQVVIWIGYLQWMLQNGFVAPSDPVLEPFENIKNMDAILDLSDPENPKEPEWPAAEFIVGNPPFLGGNKIRAELGNHYIDKLFKLYEERVPAFADLCCYWFDQARKMIETRRVKRVGLLATQGIRGGANRAVLERIKQSGDIFFAVGDMDWILDGATVHISMVGFDDGTEKVRLLEGRTVSHINANLASAADVTTAKKVAANAEVSFMGSSKKGAFDIAEDVALRLVSVVNPHGKPSSDVVRPWSNGKDVTQALGFNWIIDFPPGTTIEVAALYEGPFEYLRTNVFPTRSQNNRAAYRDRWWLHAEPRPEMRRALSLHKRFIVTPTVSKHRLFVWMNDPRLPDQQLITFARSDDYFFGILHSRYHEAWSRAPGMGTQVRERESGFRYTPTTCFETFPFPNPTAEQQAAIATAAKELDTLRTNWLNPPEWTKEEVLEFPGSVSGPWARYVTDADARGIGTVRYPRLVAKDDDCALKLKKRTLTNLYNERPTWLALAHQKLDAAVAAAYGWPADLAEEEILARLLKLNLERANVV